MCIGGYWILEIPDLSLKNLFIKHHQKTQNPNTIRKHKQYSIISKSITSGIRAILPATMAKGARMSQLAETVKQLQGASTALAEEQTKQGVLMEKILQQLNKLASSYDSLVQSQLETSQEEALPAISE